MGVGSVSPGDMQLLLHRSLPYDDGKGMNEGVIDRTKVEISLWLSVGT